MEAVQDHQSQIRLLLPRINPDIPDEARVDETYNIQYLCSSNPVMEKGALHYFVDLYVDGEFYYKTKAYNQRVG